MIDLYRVDVLLQLFSTLVRVAFTDHNRHLIQHLGNDFVNYEATNDCKCLPGNSL